MSTVAQPTILAHPQFPDHAATAVGCAKTHMPQRHDSIDLAAEIVLAGGVTPSPLHLGGWKVQSQSTPDRYYDVVENVCNCRDYELYATPTNGYACKHVLASWLYRRVEKALAPLEPVYTLMAVDGCWIPVDTDQTPCQAVSDVCPHEAPVPPMPSVQTPPALPEAPASCNVRVMLHGREVQLTLRDTCESRLLERLEVVMQRFPVEVPAAMIISATSAATPMCETHGQALKESSKAPGTFFCPRRLGNGTYCQSRFPQKGKTRDK